MRSLQLKRLVFPGFLVLVHLFYWPTYQAGFVTDFTGLLMRLEGQSIFGALNSFGFPALQPVLNVILYLFVKWFGLAPLPWYLLFTTVHTLNGWMLFRLGERLMQHWGVKKAMIAALGGALVFLLSPYATEVLVWRVCFNFLFSTLIVLMILWNSIRWLETREQWFWWYSLGWFLVGVFSFELVFAAPLLQFFLLIWWWKEGKDYNWWSLWRKLNALPWGLVGLYFIMSRLFLGAWIGHYGAAVHLKWVWSEVLGNIFRFMAKYLAFVRYWPHPQKEALFLGLGQNEIAWGLTTVGFVLLVMAWRNYAKLSAPLRLAGFFLLGSVLALAPVITLYFNYLQFIENDRYGYLFSAFWGIGFVLLVSRLPVWLGNGLLLGYLILSGALLWQTNQYWQQSTTVYRSLLDSFEYTDHSEIYVLNLPDNLMGAVMFRDYSGADGALKDPLKYLKGKTVPGSLYEVAQYNMTQASDGVEVVPDSSDHWTITFNQWGNWWWRRGLGATNYETDQYEFTNQGHSFSLQIKENSTQPLLLYQDGGNWKIVEMPAN